MPASSRPTNQATNQLNGWTMTLDVAWEDEAAKKVEGVDTTNVFNIC